MNTISELFFLFKAWAQPLSFLQHYLFSQCATITQNFEVQESFADNYRRKKSKACENQLN
jgi:hypothetical protein